MVVVETSRPRSTQQHSPVNHASIMVPKHDTPQPIARTKVQEVKLHHPRKALMMSCLLAVQQLPRVVPDKHDVTIAPPLIAYESTHVQQPVEEHKHGLVIDSCLPLHSSSPPTSASAAAASSSLHMSSPSAFASLLTFDSVSLGPPLVRSVVHEPFYIARWIDTIVEMEHQPYNIWSASSSRPCVIRSHMVFVSIDIFHGYAVKYVNCMSSPDASFPLLSPLPLLFTYAPMLLCSYLPVPIHRSTPTL